MRNEANAGAWGLLEREVELKTLEGTVERACRREGGAVVIEGSAGIGKTALLARAREYALEHEMRVVAARGAELERRFPFGVVRQFFESFLFTVAPDGRSQWLRRTGDLAARMEGGDGPPEPASEFALLHSLYWLCVNIADEQPLLMVLDDAQWADAPSLKFVEFACRRLEQLPLSFLVATRAPDEQAPAPLLTILADPGVQLIRPSPLSTAAVEELVRTAVDPQADTGFAQACHDVTNGNPFLLRELLHEVLDESVPATAAAAASVRAIGPKGIARVVLLRLGRLPEPARRLAEVLSVAGAGMTVRQLAELVDLDEREAAAAVASLEQAEIVEDGTQFAHPVVRTAIYSDLPVVTRADLHLRVAELKVAQARAAEEVATHLLHVEPGAAPWIAPTLREAARRAAAAGDSAGAERLLERALREPIDAEEHAEMLAELGAARARLGKPDGAGYLKQAATLIADPARSAAVSLELANVLKFSLNADEAAEVLADAIDRLPENASPPLRRRLQAELLGTRFISPLTQERVRAELAALQTPGREPADLLDSFLLAAAAFDTVATLGAGKQAVEFGRRALHGDVVPSDPALGGQALIVASVALIWAEDFDFVLARLGEALAAARAAGSPFAVGNISTMRAMANYRAGNLLDAEADAAATLELAREVAGLETLLAPAVGYAVLCGIERESSLEELQDLGEDRALDRGSRLLPHTQLTWARAELALARDDPEAAMELFAACDLPDPGYGGHNPTMVPWREGAAMAQLRLGDLPAARRLAADAVERAERFGAGRALGVALRAAALVEDGAARITGLHRSVEVLQGAGSGLELARAQCDLGAALRASGKRTEAQSVLSEAHQLATRIGASRVARRAAEELAAAGVRPKRERLGGIAALTPSERRVAELAAGSKTNREIAQLLFVTEKTVETHLGHVYDKLGIRSRHKLLGVLEPPMAA